MEKIQQALQQLQRTLKSASADRHDEAAQLARDLYSLCLERGSDTELAYTTSVLFSSEDGVLHFLRAATNMDEFSASKEELLRLLAHYLQALSKTLLPYAVDIKDVCLMLFARDKTSKVKAAIFPVLTEVLQLCVNTAVAQDLNVAQMGRRFFEACMKPAKLTATVRGGVFHILGILCELYPEHMTLYADKLVDVYIRTLKGEMQSKTKKPEMLVIAGCLRGLSGLLTNFEQIPLSASGASSYTEDIYRFTRMAIDPEVSLSRFDVPRAGLSLLGKHAPLFGELLTRDHHIVYQHLFRWSSHQNRDMRLLGFTALEAFLQQVSEFLLKESSDKETRKAIFTEFIRNFRSIIDDRSSEHREMAVAIRGYGYFAAPCRLFMVEEDVKFMFNEMIQRSEQLFLLQGGVILGDIALYHLPTFLEALASILKHIDKLSESFLSSLERLVVVLVEHYPRLAPSSLGPLCHKVILLVLVALAEKGPMLQPFVSHVVYQGLIRTCSHQVVLDSGEGSVPLSGGGGDGLDVLGTKLVSYLDYVDLWVALCSRDAVKSLRKLPAEDTDSLRLVNLLMFDELMAAVLKIVGKLDLSSQSLDEGEEAATGSNSEKAHQGGVAPAPDTPSPTQPHLGLFLQPTKPPDFHIFLNLVDCFRTLIPKVNPPELMEKWMFTMVHELITQSSKQPIVSGFYKMLGTCMVVCKRIGYFGGGGVGGGGEEMETEAVTDLANRRACFSLMKKFTKEVLVKTKQYKEDLVASCLGLLLSLPAELVELEVQGLMDALQTALRLGLGYPPLARAALDALDTWSTSLPPSLLQPYYSSLLPVLDDYLKAAGDEGDKNMLPPTSATLATTSKKRLPVKAVKDWREGIEGAQSPTALIRLRVIQLLGSLGGQVNRDLAVSDSEALKKAVAWDTQKRLEFVLPFQDLKPSVFLDPFLPRVCELALTSSDRQTKIASCELLHAVVLYVVGRGAQPGATKKYPMTKVYRKLFPVILQLACDMERVAEQLFRPLVFQLVHWFTGNTQYESPDTVSLLEAFLEGIVHPTDASLRDFSAQCVKEFLQWSIKQTTKQQQEKSPINTKSLLKRLYSLASHPSAAKRLGAALAFNAIYTVLREEKSLVDMFVMEMLVCVVNSLKQAHKDPKSLGTQDQLCKTVAHLSRIIRAWANLLNKPGKLRRKPRGMRGSEMPHLVTWVVTQCGTPETACRKQCMGLFLQLAPLQQGIPSPREWVKKTVESEGGSYFVQVFENGGQPYSGVLNHPTLTGDVFAVSAVLHWLDLLLASIDAYSWALEKKLLSPCEVFSTLVHRPGDKESKLFASVNFFLEHLALQDIHAAAECFKSGHVEELVFTPREVDLYKRAVCMVTLGILQFLSVLLQTLSEDTFSCIPRSFWSEPLYSTVLHCCLLPQQAGFDPGDIETAAKLPAAILDCLKNLASRLPEDGKATFLTFLSPTLLRENFNVAHQLGDFPQEGDHSHLNALLSGYLTLAKAGLLKPALKDWPSLAHMLLDSVMKLMVHSTAVGESQGESPVKCCTLDPTGQQLARKLLELALELGVEDEELLKLLFSGVGGHIFYQSLQPQICSHLARNQETFIPALMGELNRAPEVAATVIGGIVEQVLRDLSLRRRYSSSLYHILLESWGRLDFLWGEPFSLDLRMTAVSLLKKALTLEPKGLTSLEKGSFECVFGMVKSLLEETRTGLSFKSRVLELLPYFGSVKGTYATQLRDSLNKMVAMQFPLRSSEFPAGSSQYHEYTAAINRLLNGLVAMDTTVLLEVVVGVMCREERHAHEEQMQMKLVEFVRGISNEKAKAALDCVHAFFTNHSQYDPQVRRAAAERVLLTLLKNCSEVALRQFFIQHIPELMATVEAKETKVSDSHLEAQLSSMICCFKLVEVAYTRLSALDLNSSESQLNEAYNGGDKKTGKELTKAATKTAHATRSEYVLDDSPTVKALRRQCHCAAYNLLAAVISCTQSKMEFYNVFLFKEDVLKGQMLWDNLIDPDNSYNFGVELDAPLVRKKQLTTIRDEYHTAGKEEGENGGSPLSPPPDPTRYLSSIYLTESSLSQDVSQFDFSTGTQVVPRVSYPSGEGGGGAGNSYVVSEEQVEQDALNTHECMSTLTTLLDHMEHNKINPQVPKGHQPTEMLPWMSALHKKLTDGKTHNNIRLFIARLITNRPRVFQPYAKFWLPPLAQLVVAGHLGREGMNYFLVDVMVTMLSWSTTAVLEDSYLATRLLEFLMDNCHHDNRGVFRNNLEIIKTLVECWRDHLKIPAESIYRHFSDSGSDSKRNRTGIQLLGIVLANGLPPYTTDAARGVSEESFYRALVGNLGNKYKEVYAAAAEVLGMTLNYISEQTHTDAGPLHDIIADQLQSLLQQRNEDRFTVCLHKLAEAYPPLVERLYSKVLFVLPSQSAFFKTLSLETLLTRADTLPNLYQELKANGFLALLGHRDEAMQVASLQLARVMVRTMPMDQLTELLPLLTAFSSHSSAQCRSVMYDILIWVYNSVHGSESDDGSAQAQVISQTVRGHLLAGLSDDTEANRLKLFEFWNEDSRLPSDTLGRLSQLLAVLYSPSTEGQFLSCCMNLMLQLTWRSPDYSRPLFDVPLSECKFQEQSIDLSWQQRHLQMTPLFAATQASQPGSAPAVPMEPGMLRATQQAGAFIPTQDLAPGDSVGYNWMAPMQQSMDSLSFTIGAGSTVPEPQQSSLLFSLARTKRPAFKTLKPPGETFAKGALQPTTSAGTQQPTDLKAGQQQDVMRLKRRFHTDRRATSTFFGQMQTRKKLAQEETRQYRKAARDSQVVMYRQYREGELPDIQIKYSELIRPLQALAQRDSVLARQLFAAVFCAVFGQVDWQLTESEAASTRKAVQDGMNAVLSASVQYVPSFIGSMLEICFQEKQIEVNSHTTASACLASSQQPMGIMVLEKQLLYGAAEDSGRTSKRSRGTRQVTSETTSNWIELARLYKSLGEYDVLRGVFSSHIGAQTVTKEALAAEERGDFKEALDQYKQALSKDWGDEPPTEAEEDFWERAQLNCYDHLTKWKELEQAVEVNIDDHKPANLDKVWEDAFYQEHYLPYLVRSKLKLASIGVSDTAFDTLLESSLQEESKRVVLESRYSAELAMHYILKDDYNRAKYYTDIAMQGFLQEWSTLSPLFEENRAACLRGLQKIVEVKEFLEFASKTGSVIPMASIDELLQKWNARFPHPKRDPISVWDDIVTNRCVLMEKMLLKCQTSVTDVSTSSMESMEVEYGSSYLKKLQLRFSREYVALYFRIAESARLQGNYPVAKHYLQLIDSAIKTHLQEDQELPLKWLWSVTEMRLRQAGEDPSPRCIEAIIAVLKQFAARAESNEMLTTSPAAAWQHHLLHAKALHHVGDVMLDMATGPRLMESYTDDKLQHFLAVAGSSPQVEPATLSHYQLAHLLHQKALSTYKQGYKAAQSEQEATSDKEGMLNALVALATFCDKALRADEEKENPTKLDTKTFPKVVVAYTLKAMQLGSLVARQQFPRLLQLLELYPQTVDDFSKKAKEVPVWMFLGWRNQMMALLDKPEGRALHGIMFSMAREYPQALCYSFKISSSSFNFDTSTEEGRSNKGAVEEMTAMLEMRAVDDFVAALEQLTSPELLWKDLCDTELKPLMEASERDVSAIKSCWRQIHTNLLDMEGKNTLSEDSLYSTASGSQLEHGQKRKNFVNAYRETIENKFGKDGSKLISMSISNFNKIVQGLNGDMRDKMQSGRGLLKDYSPWLASFQANQYPQQIEVPGQYNGDRKPMLEYHVKIVGFDEKILVLNSIRKPKRIIIRGDDEWEYPFLVKGGEDLRLDQRIEQLFGIMNQILREDPACCQRGLRLQTYKVVPMTPRVGVIEWLQNTKPLKEFLLEAMTEEEMKKYQSILKMQQRWLARYGRGGDLVTNYKAMYRKANRTETVQEYRQKVAMVPWDLSRRAFMQLAASPEAFLMLRSHFTRSYATVCMCHYALGIGDRHLSNFMVDLHSGGAVGIDFGHAFGTATQFLPLPELMPFRLTPQIINLLRPLSESGQLRSCMVHSMRALRTSPLLLLNTMEVFIKEPSLDWKVNARKQAAAVGMKEDSQEANWYPREKVDLAKKKLQGFNPAHLMKKDLVQGHGRSLEYSSLDSLLMGERQLNIRAMAEVHCSSVEEQVACLIDLATDANILGRTYQGWEPWV